MKTLSALILTMAVAGAALVAQEPKPVPTDSVRVTVSGCAKGYVFTAGPTIGDLPDRHAIPEGMHLRMNGPKKLITEIDDYKDSMISITGLMKKGQFDPRGIGLGGGVRVSPGTGSGSGVSASVGSSAASIDVEGWSPAVGKCITK
jgi:hypothetical protein